MDFLYIILTSVISFAILFVLAKLMGFRAIGELSFFDYVTGITIGSIAAEMATNLELDWWKSVTSMCIYAILSIVLAVTSQKSIKMRKIISGKPIILIDKGRVNKNAVKKAKIDINDLLTQARLAGFFDLTEIDYGIMETTGQISFLPTPQARPLNPVDFNFNPTRKGICVNVVIDGKIMEENLKDAGVTKKELERLIRKNNKKAENLLLATINMEGEIAFFDK